jgi:alkylation response protein AidB-like acyl-CoA dehydrogenase
MHFALTEDQMALRGAVREVLATACPPATVRDAWDREESTVDAVWTRLAENRPARHGRPVSTVDGSRALLRVGSPERCLVIEDAEPVRLAHSRSTLATAAQLVGLGRRTLQMTVAYVKERRQFGVPVGSLQGVKHPLAGTVLQFEFAAPAVLATGWALASDADITDRDVSAAAVLAVDAARSTARTAIQCHGAIGYTVEYDLHLFAKRAWALAATFDVDENPDRLAGALDLTGTEVA